MNIPEFGTPEAGTIYHLRPGAHAVIVEGTRIAVVRTRIGLMLPGGGVDAGESAEQAVQRETREECGLLIELRREFGTADELVFARTEQRHCRKRARFFEARVIGSAPPTEDDHELVWMHTTDALAQLAYGSHRWALERWLQTR